MHRGPCKALVLSRPGHIKYIFLWVLCLIPVILELGELGRRNSVSSVEASMGYSIRLCLKMIRQKKYIFCNPQRKPIKRDSAEKSVNAWLKDAQALWHEAALCPLPSFSPLPSPALVVTYSASSDCICGKGLWNLSVSCLFCLVQCPPALPILLQMLFFSL